MKNTCLLFLLFSTILAKSQGPQQLVDVVYDSWPGATVKGWLYLPADYASSTKKYPVVFFYHGLGEAGSNPYTLLNNGIPNLIANGMRPDNITNPADGQQYSFIVVSVQHWSWSPNPLWLPYELNWLKQNYRVDTNRVYVTGLSAGGQMSYSAAIINNDVSKLVAAAVPMSPAQVWPYDPSLISQNKIKTWFFAGNIDGGYTNNATTYSTDCNTEYPGSSKLNIYPGGHCCWNNYYSTTWHDATTGYSIWEWMLTNTRTAAVTLPVNFVKLEAKKSSNNTLLNWQVGEELHLSKYEIEKSTDGRSFVKIGTVAATGKTDYSFTEARLSAQSFYRIRSVDLDGQFRYSSVVNFKGGNDAAVVMKAFPLPAQNEVTIQHPAAVGGGKLFINAADGRMINTVATAEGTQQTMVNLSALKPGSYFVRYDDGNGTTETIKIAKQ